MFSARSSVPEYCLFLIRHNTQLHRSKESLRSGTEGGDLEMHDEAQRTRIVC